MPATSLRILHISDIHFRWTDQPGERADFIKVETYRRNSVIAGAAWQRNVATIREDGPIDLVCFTGDIADWGRPQEFAKATEFVNALLESLNLTRDRLFIVPGNHDIDRSVNKEIWESTRERCIGRTEQTSRWLAGLKPPTGIEPAWRDRLLERYAAFWTWLERDLERGELLPSLSTHGRLGYSIDVGPRLGLRAPFWLIGLDTAWLAGDDHDARKLMLTEDQIRQLATQHGHPLPGFRLAIGHHPLTELADESFARRLLADNVDVYLHGHQHEALSAVHGEPGRTSIELAAGCLFEGTSLDKHKNGHTIITLEIDEFNRPQHVQLRLRSWSKEGMYWHDDSGIYESAKNGRLTLTWPGAVAPSAASPAFSTTQSGADLEKIVVGNAAQQVTVASARTLAWTLDATLFEDTLIELIYRSSDIPIRLFLESIERHARERLTSGDTNALDDFRTILDRVAIVAAVAVRFDNLALLQQVVARLVSIYDSLRGISGSESPAAREQLWLDVIVRVYGLGGLAVRSRNWAALRVLALQRTFASNRGRHLYWLRETLTRASHVGLLSQSNGPQIPGLTVDHAKRSMYLRPDLAEDDEELLNSILRFDLLACMVLIHETGDEDMDHWVPVFALWDSYRVEPALALLISDHEARAVLLPEDDAGVAHVASVLDRGARKLGRARWDGWETAGVSQFLKAHPKSQQ